MNGTSGARLDGRRRKGIQQVLVVVSGVLAADQLLKWVWAMRAGIERTIDPVPWQATAAVVALALSVLAVGYLFDRNMLSAPVLGLVIGGMASVTIDAFVGETAGFSPGFGSIADLAVALAVVWAIASTVLGRLMYRDPVIAAHRHHLAA